MRIPERIINVFLVCLFLLVAITGCQAKTTPTDSLTIVQSDTSQEPISNSIPVRFRLITTSSWTDFKVISGADLTEAQLLSNSNEADTVTIDNNQLLISQDDSRSASGESVEMLVEGRLNLREDHRNVLMMIERGNLGVTRLDVLKNVENEWLVIQSYYWDGLKGDSLNSYSVKVASEDFHSKKQVNVVEIPIMLPYQLAGIPKIGDAVPISPVIGLPTGSQDYPWWNDSVFYEIFVRSYFDSDGDGIGDFAGITQKLDYLNDGDPKTIDDLGISGLWLMPINPSPSYHGYDVTDYYDVNPQYGTMQDFKTMLAEAHKRGIRIIIDLVLNHTSLQHPWFQASLDPNSPYRDWYVWSDTDPGYGGSWGQKVWHSYGGSYYYGTFAQDMPDLNYNNPEVTAEMENVTQFWLETVGVDGFRLDAALYLIEEGRLQKDTESSHQWFKNFFPFYNEVNPDALVLGEVWDETAIISEYLQGDELDLGFEFYLASATINAVNGANNFPLKQQLTRTNKLIPDLRYAPFLTNHDQERAMSQFHSDPEKAKVAAAVLLTSPGVPFLYYGEEIGMQGTKPDPEIRTPMQWSTDENAGFSIVNPWQPLNPEWETVNVAMQTDVPTSVLSQYRTLIQVRNQHIGLRVGDANLVTTSNRALYSILRVSEQESVLVLINLGDEPVDSYALSLEASKLVAGEYTLTPILGEGEFAPLSVNSQGGFFNFELLPEIPAYAVMVLQLRE